MGRRAKNKQPPPTPFVERSNGKGPRGKEAAKGKRKATDEIESSANKSAKRNVLATAKVNGNKVQAPKKSSKEAERSALFDEEDDDDDDDEVDEDEDDGFEGLSSGDEEELDDAEDEFLEALEGNDDDEAEPDTDDEMAALGLGKKGQKLSARQKKKALAEAERLEELLKSQGYSLDGDDDDEVGAEDDEDEEYDEDDADDVDDEDDEGDFEGSSEEEEDDDLILPTLEDGENSAAPVTSVDLQAAQMRIQEIVNVLNNFQELEKKGRSRSEYTEQLLHDICHYYGYNRFLAEKFFELFSPTEAVAFFEANETPRPVTIRANTLRTRRRDLAQALINRGVNLEPLPGKWTKVGLQVFESSVPIGATPEYLAGHYMLQAASSFLPCIALAPQPNERVLDMASAPGGKSTYLSALMQNTGVVFANDSNKARTKSLTANVHRLGCSNVVVCNYDARMFPKVIGGFDRVLLDSPCSGSGVVSKDASVKTNKSERDLQLLTHLQKQLILCAIDSVNPRSKSGGYVVYSTCSVLVEENEQVVQYALEKRKNVRIVPTGIDFGREGYKKFRGRTFDDKMNLTKRIFPHVHNMDGFFFCKLKVEATAKTTSASTNGGRSVANDALNAADISATSADNLGMTTFDDESDAAIITKSLKRRQSSTSAPKSKRNSTASSSS